MFEVLLFCLASAVSAAAGNGIDVPMAAVDERVRTSEFRLQTQIYELRRHATDQLLLQNLLEREARARAMTVAELRRAEIDAKVQQPPQAKLEEAYERSRTLFPSESKEEILTRILAAILKDRLAERETAFRDELAAKYNVIYFLQQPRIQVDVPVSVPTAGSAKGSVQLVVFADFECPACQLLESVLRRVIEQHPSDVRVALVTVPPKNRNVGTYGPVAMACAQGRSWELYQALFRFRADADAAWVRDAAESVGLERRAFQECLDSPQANAAVREGLAFGERLGITGTPTIFVNGRLIVGVPPAGRLELMIREELDAARRTKDMSVLR